MQQLHNTEEHSQSRFVDQAISLFEHTADCCVCLIADPQAEPYSWQVSGNNIDRNQAPRPPLLRVKPPQEGLDAATPSLALLYGSQHRVIVRMLCNIGAVLCVHNSALSINDEHGAAEAAIERTAFDQHAVVFTEL